MISRLLIIFISGMFLLVGYFVISTELTFAQTNQSSSKKAKDSKKSKKSKNADAPTKVKKNSKGEIELNFNDLDLKTMVELISQATDTAFLYENNLSSNKKITLLSTGSYKIKDAYRIFENILDLNGYTTLKEGPYVRIINKKEARTNQAPIVKSTLGSITQGDFITMVVPINNTNVKNIRGAITPFLSPTTLINQYIPANVLIIRDGRGNIKKIVRLINLLDQQNAKLQVGRYPILNVKISSVLKILSTVFIKNAPSKNTFLEIDNNSYSIIAIAPTKVQDLIESYIKKIDVRSENTFEFYSLDHISAKEALKMANHLFPQSASSKSSLSSISIVVEERVNRLLLIGPKPILADAKAFLKQIDVPIAHSSSNYKVFHLNNSDANEIAKTLQKVTGSGTFSAVAESKTSASTSTSSKKKTPVRPTTKKTKIAIVGDTQTNSLVVFASTSELKLIEQLIEDLDAPRPQVFLEVMIMEVSLDKSLNLGINWKGVGKTGESLVGVGLGGSANFIPPTPASVLSQGQQSAVGLLGPSLTYNGQSFSSYSAFIQATRRDSDFNLISNPQILTVSNQQSTIKVGEVRPFQTATRVDVNNNITTSYEYKEVGVSLTFTARISDDDTVGLKIAQSTKNVKESATSTLTPTTIERNITTNIITKNREIIVLGGLINTNQNNTEQRTYCLGDIPILGELFKASVGRTSKSNLLVYIKPTIVRTSDDRDLLNKTSSYYFNKTTEDGAEDSIAEKLNLPIGGLTEKPTRINLKNIEDLPKILGETKDISEIQPEQEPILNKDESEKDTLPDG
ncbi:MAG: hypothetical protein JJV97_04120 [SAR324 cluster bacterium]|nr:hypothetical protein [SAR324 cluster bacterium]